ncbi:hypothetical protein [Hymenobacter glaciei]|uniref:hypothetical protein n=1 Tax=Hymenobacter glaciei TaxID=877209 RepID=UPI0031EA211C
MEFGEMEVRYDKHSLDEYFPSGYILRPSFDLEKSKTWSYALGEGWSLLPQTNGLRRYNGMIKLEVKSSK